MWLIKNSIIILFYYIILFPYSLVVLFFHKKHKGFKLIKILLFKKKENYNDFFEIKFVYRRKIDKQIFKVNINIFGEFVGIYRGTIYNQLEQYNYFYPIEKKYIRGDKLKTLLK